MEVTIPIIDKTKEGIEKIKTHVKEHKTAYIWGGGAVLAGITLLIMRGRNASVIKSLDEDLVLNKLFVHPLRNQNSECISRANGVTAGRDIVMTGKSVLNSVSYISANRKGSPSWVIRCIETGLIFTSQRAAALSMGLSESHISSHLNGVRNHVNGYTFERICMAA